MIREDDQSMIGRFRFYMSLPEECEIERIPSEALDVQDMAKRFPIPSSTLFSQLKYAKFDPTRCHQGGFTKPS